MGRLTQATASNGVTSYAYDDRNNRINEVNGQYTKRFTYNIEDQLLREIKTQSTINSITNYAYDFYGNLISKVESVENQASSSKHQVLLLGMGEMELNVEINQYDVFNRLIFGKNNDHEYAYTYNIDGLRTSKTVDGNQNSYYWNGSKLILDYTNDSYVNNKFYYGQGLISRYNGSTNATEFYQKNGTSDVSRLLNTSGNLIKQYSYDAFGKEQNIDPSDTNPMRYNAEFYDKETGQQYLRARYYDPTVGRFTTRDSYLGEFTNPKSLNYYTYCQNDPINLDDPSGHDPYREDHMDEANEEAINQGSLEITSFFMGMIPVADVIKDIAETITKRDICTGRRLSENDYSGMMISAMLPIYNRAASEAGEVFADSFRGVKKSRVITGGTKTEKIIWPPNGGAIIGTEKNVVLTKGYRFDRYGYDGGSYVAPAGTPFEMRSLASGSVLKPYKVFEVIKPVRGKGSVTAPWFNQQGGGLQFELEHSIEKLKELKRIKEVTK